MWENLLHANQMDCVTHFSCFFFSSCFPRKFCGLGNSMQKPLRQYLLAVCNPPSFSTSFLPLPRASHRAACCKRTEKTSLIRKYWAQFKAIAQSGVVWWHLQTMEEIGFAVKHPPRTSILAYRTVQQLGAVQSRVSWLEGDTWSPAVPVNESQVWGGMLARKSSLTETHSGIQK